MASYTAGQVEAFGMKAAAMDPSVVGSCPAVAWSTACLGSPGTQVSACAANGKTPSACSKLSGCAVKMGSGGELQGCVPR